ncbi:MAG: metallophosphoesterase [Ferruginibacter sp.]|nr:metallophosphoesterase [Ferruginibacter sp.]
MNRREFVKYASAITILLSNGKILRAGELNAGQWEKGTVKLRFVIASDGHYGQKDTDYEKYFETLVTRINEEHAKNPFAFCMINGDIIHDDKQYFPAAKKALDKLELKYYVSQGNHDHATPEEWESTWKMPLNLQFVIKENSFIIATTSNETGAYLCPDVQWIKARLEEHKRQKNVFIFLHINPGKQTKYGVDCPELFEVFAKHKNIRAVFNGHDHDEEGIKMKNKLPFIFDAHFGGNWGTAYRGFRVVELMKDNSIATYIMNPIEKINEANFKVNGQWSMVNGQSTSFS